MKQLDDRTTTAIEKSKTRWKIAAIISWFLTLVFLIYAFVQKGIADENLRMAERTASEVAMQRKLADRAMEAARATKIQLEEALKKLNK